MLLDLPGGRALDVVCSGPSGAVPVLNHHGTPGSGRPVRAHERAAHAAGLRFVACSRAGYSGSTRQPGRCVADVAADMAAVLDHLGEERCLTAGWSGGGPHALATAALLGDRVAGVAVIAGVAPYDAEGLDFLSGMGEDNVEEFGLALQGEAVLRPWLEAHAAELRGADASAMVAAMASILPPVDREVMTDEFGADLAASTDEGLRGSVDGWLDDDLAFTRPWGFDLDSLAVPVSVWQGDLDLMVPASHGAWLAKHVPGATPHLLPEDGHVSVAVGRAGEIFAELAGTLAG